MLLTGNVDPELVERYPELRDTSLRIQIEMFRSRYEVRSLSDAQHVLQEIVPEVRALFPAVEQLVKLMLIIPVSSCTAERSFSSLRRLKTWMRSTMSQQRLNAVSLCNVHRDILDNLDINQLACFFSQQSDIRRGLFGNWA
jgi:hypothetical protein